MSDNLRSIAEAMKEEIARHAEMMIELRSCFGNQMRAQRQDKGISVRELARILNLSAPFITDVELGRRGLGDETLRRVLEQL